MSCVCSSVPLAEIARRASIEPYSATVGPIPTKPATPIHRTRSRDGSTAISWPGMSHRGVDPCSTLSTAGAVDSFYLQLQLYLAVGRDIPAGPYPSTD